MSEKPFALSDTFVGDGRGGGADGRERSGRDGRPVSSLSYDVVVVGAGTAGANTAVQFARRGRSVLLLDQRSADAAGARWDNGIVEWQFTRAGIAFPDVEEDRRGGRTTTVMVGPGGTGFRVEDPPTRGADMRALVAMLQAEATELGVELREGVRNVVVRQRGGRVNGITFTDGDGRSRGTGSEATVDAALVVDASGRRGAVREQVPNLAPWCPPVEPSGCCSAAQYEHRIADPDAARRFLDRHGAAPGDTVTFVGFAGGFSALAISTSPALDSVGVLTGTLGDRRWGTGPSILTLVRDQHRWIGEPIFGGAGLIPLRRPYSRFTAPGIALVGDAACQVFPAHGSGIGISLVAGAMLAEATADRDDCGAADALWGYQSGFQREFGGTLAAYDVIRRLSTRLGSDGVAALFAAGLVDAESTRAGLEQVWRQPPASELPGRAAKLLARPRLAATVLPALAGAAAALPLFDRYPSEPDVATLQRWNRATTLL